MLLALTRDSLTAMDNPGADGMSHLKALLDLPLVDGRFEYHGVHLKLCNNHVAAIHNQKSQFVNEQLERRFPQDGMTLLQSLNQLFNLPKVKAVDVQDVTIYGKRELESVLLHFANQPATGLSDERARIDFLIFKQSVHATERCCHNEHLPRRSHHLL